MIRPEYQIRITALHSGAAVQFLKDRPLIENFKARFPKARWGAGTRSWHILGVLAERRATLWAAEQQEYLRGLELGARDAEWEGREAAPGFTAPPVTTAGRSAPLRRIAPAKRIRPGERGMSINQYKYIEYQMRSRRLTRIDHPDAPTSHYTQWILWMSAAEADRWIAHLRDVR